MRRPIAIGAGVVAVLLLIWAGVLAARAYQDWQSLRRAPAVRLQDTSRIQPWMTVRFIAMSHGVAVGSLAAQLGAPPGGNVTLFELARTRGISVPQEADATRRAVEDLRVAMATPGSPPGPSGP
jgi:hypothetical protein